jgi:hypothetical protein
LGSAGFKNIEIIPFGERFTASAHLLHSFFLFGFVRFFAFAAALALDKIIPEKMKKLHPCPAGYFVRAIKK